VNPVEDQKAFPASVFLTDTLGGLYQACTDELQVYHSTANLCVVGPEKKKKKKKTLRKYFRQTQEKVLNR
jgi:hypothetical protein